MDMIGKIRRMHRRDKKTKREISRATGLSRNTVAKWLDEAELKQALKADAKRPKKERRTAKALFKMLIASCLECVFMCV